MARHLRARCPEGAAAAAPAGRDRAAAVPGTPNLPALVEVIGRALADEPELVRATEAQHRGIAVVELFMAPGDIGPRDRTPGPDRAGGAQAGVARSGEAGGKAQVEFREQR